MNPKQILTDQIADHQKAIDTAKAKLKELDEPKSSHADYGYDENGDAVIMIRNWDDVLRPCGNRSMADPSSVNKPKIITGNLMDDLKRNSKPLESFEVEDNGATFELKASYANNFDIRCYCVAQQGRGDFGRRAIKEIIQKK